MRKTTLTKNVALIKKHKDAISLRHHKITMPWCFAARVTGFLPNASQCSAVRRSSSSACESVSRKSRLEPGSSRRLEADGSIRLFFSTTQLAGRLAVQAAVLPVQPTVQPAVQLTVHLTVQLTVELTMQPTAHLAASRRKPERFQASAL